MNSRDIRFLFGLFTWTVIISIVIFLLSGCQPAPRVEYTPLCHAPIYSDDERGADYVAAQAAEVRAIKIFTELGFATQACASVRTYSIQIRALEEVRGICGGKQNGYPAACLDPFYSGSTIWLSREDLTDNELAHEMLHMLEAPDFSWDHSSPIWKRYYEVERKYLP